jgi:hypothetical protein
VLVYSIFGTLAVSFNQYQAGAPPVAAPVLFGAVSGTDDAVSGTLDSDIEYYRAEAERWRTTSWARYDLAMGDLRKAEARRDAFIAESIRQNDLLRAESKVAVEAEALRQRDAFVFAAGVFGISVDILRFIIFAIPAVFFDIAAPLLLFVALNCFWRKND